MNCCIEVPESPIASPSLSGLGSTLTSDFPGALDRLVNTFTRPKMSPMRGRSSQFTKKYYRVENMKLLVYGPESLDTLEEWIRDSMSSAEPPTSSSALVDFPISHYSQIKDTTDCLEMQDKYSMDIQSTFIDSAGGWEQSKYWGCLETDDEPTEEQMIRRERARAENIIH
jgi:secreted Zn-dependent insulinase-like peptidase